MVLATTLMCSISGCGKQTASSDTSVVTVWHGNGHDKEFMEEHVKEWNETIGKEKGVKINYVYQSGDINEKIELAFKSGSAPDIFTGGNTEVLAKNGQIVAVEDMPGGDKLLERFGDFIMPSRHMVDGKTYIIPTSATTFGLVYNKDMFRAAGIVDENGEPTPPKTLAEMREYAKRLTNADKKEYGIVYAGKFSAWYSIDVGYMGVPSEGVNGYDPRTGKYDYTATKAVLKTIMGIKRDGSCYPGFEGLDNDPARARFSEGGLGMKTAASYDYGVFTEQFPAKIDWGVAPFPVEDENRKFKQIMEISGGVFMNSESLEKIGADKLMAVYEFFHSEDLIKDKYKYGMAIPLSMDMVEGVEIDPSLKNGQCWKDFCELVSISVPHPLSIKADTQAVHIQKRFLGEIWPNDLSDDEIDRIVDEWQDAINEGIKKYQQDNPDYDPSANIDKDLNMNR